jgi:hypothetical protein
MWGRYMWLMWGNELIGSGLLLRLVSLKAEGRIFEALCAARQPRPAFLFAFLLQHQGIFEADCACSYVV